MRLPVKLGDFYLYRLNPGDVHYDTGHVDRCYMPEVVGHTHHGDDRPIFGKKREELDFFEEGMLTCGLLGSVEILSQN